jgi:flagellar hook protein FlgE
MNSIASIALSGMNAASTSLASSAHNIANAQTPGFRRQLTAQAALPEGGVSVSLTQAAAPGESLAEDVVQQIAAAYDFKANVLSLKTQDRLLGSLLDATA